MKHAENCETTQDWGRGARKYSGGSGVTLTEAQCMQKYNTKAEIPLNNQ
jgi:hypothetical protein